MFIRYQKVRNRVVGALAAVGACFCAIFGCQPMTNSNHAEPIVAHHGAEGKWEEPVVEAQPVVTKSGTPADTEELIRNALLSDGTPRSFQQSPPSSRQPKALTTNDRYVVAMKLAESRAASSGKGKDVLGSSSPWKLNLYDDDRDGIWDRAKLDTNRDEVDDEKWNFKKGRWEKDGGAKIWVGESWISSD